MGVPDEDQDMAVIWKRTLVELHRLDEIQTSSDKTIAELDKLSEGWSSLPSLLWLQFKALCTFC